MKNMTPAEVKQIKDEALKRLLEGIKKERTTTDTLEIHALELVNETAASLLNCYDRVKQHVDNQRTNLNRIASSMERGYGLGNDCGVMQNVHTLEILNGQIQVLHETVFRLNRALKLVELK